MKNISHLKTNLAAIAAILILSLSLTSCQAVASQPAAENNPQSSATAGTSTNQPGGTPESGDDLTPLDAGLTQLTSYRQQFEMTITGDQQGARVATSQKIVRSVVGKDEVVSIDQSDADGTALQFVKARLGDYQYSQDLPGVSCRAEAVSTAEEISDDPATRLPAVHSMTEAGRENVNDLATVHYTFDERSLVDDEGKVKQASGEIWLAEEGGALVKYKLSVEIASAEFSGTRTWSYLLDQVNQIDALALPDACQPVLADLPTLPGAVDMLTQPGFQRYSAPVSRAEAVTFFNEQLTALGWQPLPGSSVDKVDLSLSPTVLSFAQDYRSGSRLLVINLEDAGGQVQVIAQTTLTKQAIHPNSVSQATTTEDATSQPDEQQTTDTPPAETPPLPADLPLYPGASTLVQTDTILVLSTQDSPADVIDFYLSEMESAGWTLDQKIENSGAYVLMMSRDGANLTIGAVATSEMTQITITSISE